MKQTVEDAAYDYATNKTKFRKDVLKEVDADTYVSRHADSMEDFQCGAEWQSKQSPWISVKERLPEAFKLKLILLKDGQVRIASINFQITCFWYDRETNESFDLEDVVAWMPIPSFDDIIESNKDVLERIKEKGD